MIKKLKKVLTKLFFRDIISLVQKNSTYAGVAQW